MIFQTLKVAIAAALLVCVSNVSMGQDCGCGNYGGDYGGDYGCGAAQDNCGRSISHEDAMGLWAGYCNESCGYQGGGCGSKLCGRLRGGRQGGACGTANCDSGCFGYPAGGGCETASGCGGKLKGLRAGGCGSSCDSGCKLKGLLSNGCKLKGRLSGGCECSTGNSWGGKLKGLFSGSGCGCKLFSRSRNECGCSGAYFNEAVGYEYGNAGMQSCVPGVANSMPNQSCCGQPMAAQPAFSVPVMAPAFEGSSIGTGVTTQIEGDVVEAQGTDNVEAAVEAVSEAAAEIVE